MNTALGSKDGWLDLAVACNASLAQTEVRRRHALKHQVQAGVEQAAAILSHL